MELCPWCVGHSSVISHRSGTFKTKRLPFTAFSLIAQLLPSHTPKTRFCAESWSQPWHRSEESISSPAPPQGRTLHSHRMGHKVLDFPHSNICSHRLRTRQGLKPAALAGCGCQKIQRLPLQAEGPFHSHLLFYHSPPNSSCCFCSLKVI